MNIFTVHFGKFFGKHLIKYDFNAIFKLPLGYLVFYASSA